MKYTNLDVRRNIEGNLYTVYEDLDGDRVDTEFGNMNLGYALGSYCYPTEFGREKALSMLKEALVSNMKKEIESLEAKIKEVESL